jgi:ABC-type sugar transport system ATPase subunit
MTSTTHPATDGRTETSAPDDPEQVPTARGAEHHDVSIEVENVTKRYGNTSALDDVSITVPTGSVLAQLGHNGAGKTTLVRVLTTRVRPAEGRARVTSMPASSGSA